MKVKIIKKDGSKAEVEVDGDIDYQAMGVLNAEEVTALKTRALTEGKTSAEKIAAEKIAAAEQKLKDYEESLTDKQRSSSKAEERIAKMEQTLTALRTEMQAAQQAKVEADLARSLADARSGLAFAEGGSRIFDMELRSKMQSDGTFVLSTGERGTLEQARAEWILSPVGRALIKAESRPGNGTSPTTINGASFRDIVNNQELKEKYIEQHGVAKYTQDYLAHKAQEK